METRLEIGRSLYLIKNEYETMPTDVWFEYIEHSPDSWYSDTVTDVYIDREKAIEIINFLKDAYSIGQNCRQHLGKISSARGSTPN